MGMGPIPAWECGINDQQALNSMTGVRKSYPRQSKHDHDHEMGRSDEPKIHLRVPTEPTKNVRSTHPLVP